MTAKVLGQKDADQLAVHQAIVRAASTLYLGRFGDPVGALGSMKEFGYRVRLRSPYTGRCSRTFDLLGYADEWLDMGSHAALVENKLVGQITAANVRKLPLDRQIALECYGTWRATGKEVREVFYRYVKKPSIKQRKDETVDEFCARLEADYAERPDFYCHEEHMLRTSDDLLRVEEELWSWGQQLQWLRRQSVATRNSSHCADFGGCAYMSLCLREPGAEGLYATRTSSPREVPASSEDSLPPPVDLPF